MCLFHCSSPKQKAEYPRLAETDVTEFRTIPALILTLVLTSIEAGLNLLNDIIA